MSRSMAAIHAMKKELGLDEGAYRGLLDRVTGKASLRDMSEPELQRVAADMRSKGAGQNRGLAGPYGGKLQALWISGWNLGVVRNRDDAALLAFVKARTGIEHVRFLRDAKDARKAVEALKLWLARDAGVDWSAFDDPQACVLAAQLRILGESPDSVGFSAHGVTSEAGRQAVREIAMVALMQRLGEKIRAMPKAGTD